MKVRRDPIGSLRRAPDQGPGLGDSVAGHGKIEFYSTAFQLYSGCILIAFQYPRCLDILLLIRISIRSEEARECGFAAERQSQEWNKYQGSYADLMLLVNHP